VFTTTERELTTVERQHLSDRRDKARAESRLALVKTGAASVLVCGGLAVATVMASDAPPWVAILFWAALAMMFTLWIGLPWRRLMRGQVVILDDGLRTNRASVTRIRSVRVLEFEEEEDEGACYAFELGPDTSLFIVGQEFYEDDDFPNSDFSMVDVLGAGGGPIDTIIEKHGIKLMPDRVVPATIKWQLEIPEHMTVVPLALNQIVDRLPRSRGRVP